MLQCCIYVLQHFHFQADRNDFKPHMFVKTLVSLYIMVLAESTLALSKTSEIACHAGVDLPDLVLPGALFSWLPVSEADLLFLELNNLIIPPKLALEDHLADLEGTIPDRVTVSDDVIDLAPIQALLQVTFDKLVILEDCVHELCTESRYEANSLHRSISQLDVRMEFAEHMLQWLYNHEEHSAQSKYIYA